MRLGPKPRMIETEETEDAPPHTHMGQPVGDTCVGDGRLALCVYSVFSVNKQHCNPQQAVTDPDRYSCTVCTGAC